MIKYSLEELQQVVSESISKSEVCRKLGLRPVGGNFRRVSDDIKKYGLDISHFTGKPRPVDVNAPIPLDDILDKGLPCSSTTLKNRLLRSKYKKHVCEGCGNTTWQGLPIPLELHHINGIHNDNHRENLLLLCPNCHALTETFRGRKPSARYDHIEKVKDDSGTIHITKKRYEKICPVCNEKFTGTNKRYCSDLCCRIARGYKRPDPFDLLNKLKEIGSYEGTGRYYGVSGKSIKKWIQFYKLEEAVIDMKPKTPKI